MNKFKESKELLGTLVSLAICSEENPKEAFESAFAECERIEKAYSRFIESNELAKLNENCGKWVSVSDELLSLLKAGEEFCVKSGGAFDLSVCSVLEGWGYDRELSLKEGSEGQTGKLEFKEAMFRTSAPIDLGGLGKGYAVDKMRVVLKNYCENFFINAGGDTWCEGKDLNGPWKLFFENPRDSKQAIGSMEALNIACASSSANRRSWRDKHHLVEPQTMEPANKMLAVYTQASTAIEADAYSTALFVAGFDKAREMISTLPIEAMLISPQGNIWKAEGFKGELFSA
jgi:FAD:protein FMN transferase